MFDKQFVIHGNIFTTHVFQEGSFSLFLCREALVAVLLITSYLLTASSLGSINPRLLAVVHNIPSHEPLEKNT
jgi:hypothetical protein